MSPPFATSFSMLNTYRVCPKQCFHRYFARDYPFRPSEEASWGNYVHAAMEQRIANKVALPPEIVHFDNYARAFDASAAEGKTIHAELALAVDENLQRVPWTSRSAWLKAKLDTVIMHDNKAFIFDWKTGREREDPDELMVQATVLKCCFPKLVLINAAYVWLASRHVGPTYDFSTGQDERLADIRQRVSRIEQHRINNDWPATPSALCKWCNCSPIGSADEPVCHLKR
jgi:hypothetical protein